MIPLHWYCSAASLVLHYCFIGCRPLPLPSLLPPPLPLQAIWLGTLFACYGLQRGICQWGLPGDCVAATGG